MAKLQLFEVVFDGDVSIFKSGDYVRGFVRIVLGAPKNDVRGIKIKFTGKARTSWSEGSGDHRRHYSARETYFNEKIMCFGKDKNDIGASKLCMEAGEHHFPFTFQIPNIPLPFPFESCTGSIRYEVLCKIDRPWKFDHTTERLFTVIGQPIDLNLIQIARYPQHGEDSKTVCCMCCASGPILTKASTDKGAYVPGESIFVSGIVENNSNRDIRDLSAKLIQRVVFFSSGGHTQTRNVTMVKIKGPGCGPGETARMDWSPLVVPAIPPTGPQGCNIIKIEYVVEFEGDVSDTPFDATVNLPITIGTIPLYQPLYPQATGVVTQQPSANDLPPPSYELAIEGLQEIPSKSGYDYTFGKLMYAPQYPTYNMPAHQPTWDPMHPPQQIGDPAYSGGSPGYPPPGGSGYPPPGGSGYPPPPDGSGYPPSPGGSGYPPLPDGSGYPPPPGGSDFPPQDETKY